MAKFRKWLKYDVDCEFISRPELELKVSQGRCPFESKIGKTTTTTKEPKSYFLKRKRKPIPQTDKSIFSHDNKETVVRAIVGNNKMQDIDWNPTSFPDLDLIDGSMVTFKCDEENREKNRKKNEETEFIEWFINGKRIKSSWFDWRVSVSMDGRLGIWPIGVQDSGHFECLANGQLRASVTVNVVAVSNVLIKGLINYLFVCAVFSVVTISMGCLLGNRNQEKKNVEVDRMEEFLSENVFKTDQMAKEKIAGIIEQQNHVDERQLLENKAKSNRSTIMILLQNPKRENLKNKKVEPDIKITTTSTGTTTEGTTVTAEEGTTTKGSDTNVTNTNATATTNETNETEVGTTVTKTEEEDVKDGKVEEEGGESDEDDDGVETNATSKGSTATSKASKGHGRGKTKKAAKGSENTKNKKKKSIRKGKKNTKGSKGSKTKGTGKGPNKNIKKKKAAAKPAKNKR